LADKPSEHGGISFLCALGYTADQIAVVTGDDDSETGN